MFRGAFFLTDFVEGAVIKVLFAGLDELFIPDFFSRVEFQWFLRDSSGLWLKMLVDFFKFEPSRHEVCNNFEVLRCTVSSRF